MKSETIQFLRRIGISGAIPPKDPDRFDSISSLKLVEKNKIPLLFLRSLSNEERKDLEEESERCEEWHENFLKLASLTSRTLMNEGTEHTFFKTFKPFPYTPSDVDVLLRDEDSLDRTIDLFEGQRFEPLERSSYGCTFYSPEHDLNLDLTTRIDVSGLVYLDKKHVFEETTEKRIKGTKMRTPKPYADLTITAAHALYKEQLFTLSDYYTFVIWREHLEDVLEFAEKGRIKPAMLWALNLASEITKSAFGHDNEILKTIDKLLKDEDEGEEWKADEDTFEMPYNCPLSFLAKALVRKMSEDSKARNTLPKFLKNFADPKTVGEMVNHFDRETY
ncbi:hypothetical protein AKJ61_02090 [candidate division MSBL1 archaeon SCGC-AAA259B11]|uniref:Nucleotidyltransferase family protein n=1 Tax=candidate division MSBL1 archaeon SCGC-AAA259B11 TaxID=1698260 RepID=A0A133U6G3_9EURY|nr:hypothetical protein AKJ61_02090 [candidate division MSBL1 archaeon SCGC-AAA259B11]